MQQIGSWKPDCRSLFKQDKTLIVLAGPETNGEWIEGDFSDENKTYPFGLFEREDKWSSCSYFYLDKPVNDLSALESVENRLAAMPTYNDEELKAMKSVPLPVQIMKKYVKDFEQLEMEDIENIKGACEIILKYMNMQNEILEDAEQE